MMATRGAKPTRTKQLAYEAFARNDGESHASIAARAGVSRQRIDELAKAWGKLTGQRQGKSELAQDGESVDASESTSAQDHETQFVARPASAAQSARPGAATDPLVIGASSLVFYVVQWPEWAESPETIAARMNSHGHPGTIDAGRLQALVTYRMNATSQAGSFKAIGIDAVVGTDMYRRDRELRRVLDWAAGLAEVRIASNMLRLATGVGPQAAQAATLIAERQLGWTKENVLRIEGDIEHHIDVNHILSDPRLIAETNRHEAFLQALEDGEIVEGEYRQLPASGDVPPVPVVLLDDSGPNSTRVDRVPGQQDPQQGVRPMREIVVNGVRTLVGDERSPEDRDARPPF